MIKHKEIMQQRIGKTQKKIVLLLLGGVALGLSGSPKRYFKILKGISEEWKDIEDQSIKRSIKRLYESKIIREKQNSDGTITMVLTSKGKEKALTFDLDNIEIKRPKEWDKKWRIVLFDIPEKKRKVRKALGYHLKNLDFFEFQKSVFVHPYDCDNEINFLIEFYGIRKFVRFIEAHSVDNELHLKKHFGLL